MKFKYTNGYSLDGVNYQVGIQSYAQEECGNGGPSVFTQIFPYMAWIENNLEEVPIDCVWDDWEDIVGPCINGYYERKRKKKIKESTGGKCQGKATEKIICPHRLPTGICILKYYY